MQNLSEPDICYSISSDNYPILLYLTSVLFRGWTLLYVNFKLIYLVLMRMKISYPTIEAIVENKPRKNAKPHKMSS